MSKLAPFSIRTIPFLQIIFAERALDLGAVILSNGHIARR